MQQKRAVQGLEDGPGAVPGDAHCTHRAFSAGDRAGNGLVVLHRGSSTS